MAGDIVPMRGCAYIINLNTKGGSDPSNKYYGIERLRFDVMYNSIEGKKENRIYSDYKVLKTSTDRAAIDDFNPDGEPINFYPGWGGFYWNVHGNLNILWDKTFDIDAYYGCRTVATVDPTGLVEIGLCKEEITNTDRTGCDRDTPFF